MRLCILLLLAAFLSGCVFVRIPLVTGVQEMREEVVDGRGRAKIVIVEISGVLSMGDVGLTRFSREPPQIPRLREELDKAIKDRDVVALVVRIDSPGGSVTASDILYQEIDRFRRTKKAPVVVCVMDKALSGGYYAALAADRIVAHPTSVVGGVGVVALRLDLSPMLQRWGVETETVKSGDLKDFWSPLSPPRPEELAIMQEITDDMRLRFLALVKERRSLTPAALESVESARIFGAGNALRLGLIDALGYLDDAVVQAREMAGVEEARTVIYRRPGRYAENIYAGAHPLLQQMSVLEETANELLSPTFRYQAFPR
jgi:protease IV